MGIYFLSLICPCMIWLLIEKYAKRNKNKKIKMFLNMIASVYSRKCGSYKMYLKGDSPHQTIMIVCELKWYSHVSYAILRCFSHSTRNILCYSWYMCKYNVIWPITRFTCVNVYSLNCLNLFLQYKIGYICCVCVCVCFFFGIYVLNLLDERWFWKTLNFAKIPKT